LSFFSKSLEVLRIVGYYTWHLCANIYGNFSAHEQWTCSKIGTVFRTQDRSVRFVIGGILRESPEEEFMWKSAVLRRRVLTFWSIKITKRRRIRQSWIINIMTYWTKKETDVYRIDVCSFKNIRFRSANLKQKNTFFSTKTAENFVKINYLLAKIIFLRATIDLREIISFFSLVSF